MKKIPPRVGFLKSIFTRQERVALGFLLGVGFLSLLVQNVGLNSPPPAAVWQQRSKLRINRATASQLKALPKIGPVVARRIVESRRTKGLFLTLSDLSRVKGVDAKVLVKLKPLLRFD